jgi:hypothetical protein
VFGKKNKKERKKNESPQVITKDDKFYCYDCRTGVPQRQDCPACGKVIDRGKI